MMADLRKLLDDASRQDGHGVDPLEIVRVGRRRVRHRGLIRGAALVLVLVVSATAFTLRPWETGDTRGLDPVAPADPTPTPQPDQTSPRFTTPGTDLSIGETATVPVLHPFEFDADPRRTGEIELAVTGVRRGDRNDILSTRDLDPTLRLKASRGEFWYVDTTITYRSGPIGGYYLGGDVQPVLRGGRLISRWVMDGAPFAPCPPNGLPLRPKPGETADVCTVFQTRPGADVVGLQWGPFESDYALKDGEPVTWR